MADASVTGRMVLAYADGTVRMVMVVAGDTGRLVMADADRTGQMMMANGTVWTVQEGAGGTERTVTAEAGGTVRTETGETETETNSTTNIKEMNRINHLNEQVSITYHEHYYMCNEHYYMLSNMLHAIDNMGHSQQLSLTLCVTYIDRLLGNVIDLFIRICNIIDELFIYSDNMAHFLELQYILPVIAQIEQHILYMKKYCIPKINWCRVVSEPFLSTSRAVPCTFRALWYEIGSITKAGMTQFLTHAAQSLKSRIPPPHHFIPNSTTSRRMAYSSRVGRGFVEKGVASPGHSTRQEIVYSEYENQSLYYGRTLKVTWIFAFLIVFTLLQFVAGAHPDLTLKDLHSTEHLHSENIKQLDVSSWPQTQMDQQVFMVHSLLVEDSSQLDSSSLHTPEQRTTRSRNRTGVRSSQPTMGSHLTPDQKICRRVRSFSEQSDASAVSARSRSSVESKKDVIKKRDYKPKAVTTSGIYIMDPQKKRCSLNYIEDFLDSEEAERTHTSLKEGIINSSVVSSHGHGLKVDLEESEPGDCELKDQIKALQKKVERAINSIFDISTSVFKVEIKRLSTFSEHLPYESFAGIDNNGTKPVIAILSLGAPRPLNLKKGSNASHRVALHSGSLTVLAGDTSLEYKHSIPRGEGAAEHDQLVLFFIGSPSGNLDGQSDSGSVSEVSVKSTTSVPSSVDSSDSELESESEVVEISIFDQLPIPSLIVTPADIDLNATLERVSDILNHDQQDKTSRQPETSTDQNFAPDETDVQDNSESPKEEDCETTVIPSEMSQGDNNIKEDVYDHQYHPASLEWIQSVMEKALIDIKKDLQGLTDEVAGLKNQASLNLNTKSTEQGDIKERVVRQVVKELKDLWEQNNAATSQIGTRINDLINEFDAAQVKSDELDKSIRKLKTDLKGYYNSAFFREDGRLIKEMHSRICSGGILPGEELVINQSPGQPVTESLSTQPGPSTAAAVTPSNNIRRHSAPSTAELTADITTIANQTAPPPAAVRPLNLMNMTNDSRRSSGFTMTNAAQMQPLPPIIPPVTEPTRQSSSQQNQSASTAAQDSSRPRYIFKTALITDSIMRHIGSMNEGEALGQNHQLEILNKTDTRGLSHPDLRRRLEHLQPDYIYLHLGVNDILDGRSPEEALQNIRGFIVFRDRRVPDAKIMFSLPLTTLRRGVAYDRANENIIHLKTALTELAISGCPANQRLKDKRLLMNTNENLNTGGKLSFDKCSQDGIHLSSSGKSTILGNFRHHIHEITRRILNKPPRTRSSTR